MIDVRNDGHVADVPLMVHHATDFVDSEVHLQHSNRQNIQTIILGPPLFTHKGKKKKVHREKKTETTKNQEISNKKT